jgi:hypothetical protein
MRTILSNAARAARSSIAGVRYALGISIERCPAGDIVVTLCDEHNVSMVVGRISRGDVRLGFLVSVQGAPIRDALIVDAPDLVKVGESCGGGR